MNNYGDFKHILPNGYGLITLPEPMAVTVQWQNRKFEVFNGVTRAYVTNDGRVTLMDGKRAVLRLSVKDHIQHHRPGRIVNTLTIHGIHRHTILTEITRVLS